MIRRVTRLGAALAIGAMLAACAAAPGGGGLPGDGDDGASGGSAPGLGMGPGISIDEAIESTLEGPLLVNGYIVAEDGGEVRLCSALAESYPPQCGGTSLVVEGLDLATVDGLTSAEGVSWTDAETQLLGTVENGVLTVEANALP